MAGGYLMPHNYHLILHFWCDTLLPSQHVCSDWLGRLRNTTVVNDDDSIDISRHKQHLEVLSNCISYIIILATFAVAPLWPTIKRAEYLKYTLQHPCTSKIITKRWSLVNTHIQKVDLSSLRPSTFMSYKCVVTANTKLNQWIRALLQPLMPPNPTNLLSILSG